jgi:hypothetical protein
MFFKSVNMKEYISIIAIYISLKVIDKFIEDNLPNLHYKQIIKFWNTHISSHILLSYAGYLFVSMKLSSNKQSKKEYENAIIDVILILIANEVLRKEKSIAE